MLFGKNNRTNFDPEKDKLEHFDFRNTRNTAVIIISF